MNTQDLVLPIEISTEEMNQSIIDAAQDIKAKNITLIDLRKLDEAPTDFFIICEGESNTQVKSIAENIQVKLKNNLGIKPNHTEGMLHSKWVLVDYFTVMVHVFYPETREYYDLEDLWSDAEFTEYADI